MNHSFELFIALRYLLARRKQAFISLISAISALGVTVGVMALLVALALMTGLQGELRDRIVARAGGNPFFIEESLRSLVESGAAERDETGQWRLREGAAILEHDFLAEDAPELIRAALAGPADVVMSDMAPNATGHPQTDHLRIVALCEVALDFARSVLVPGGTFVAKVFQGGAQGELMALLKRDFGTVRHAKPPASRRDSAEIYVVAQDFRGVTEPRGED